MKARMPWRRVRRGLQLLAGLLVVGVLGQSVGLIHVGADVVPQSPVLDDRWLAPPGPTPPVRLDRFGPAAPVPMSAAASLAAGPDALRLTLQGVIVSESPRAYVVDESTHQTLTVRPGDHVGPITVKTITARTVVIEREGETYELRL